MADKLETQNQQDLQLKEELRKIDYSKFMEYGSIKIQVRKGQMALTTIERTYPD